MSELKGVVAEHLRLIELKTGQISEGCCQECPACAQRKLWEYQEREDMFMHWKERWEENCEADCPVCALKRELGIEEVADES